MNSIYDSIYIFGFITGISILIFSLVKLIYIVKKIKEVNYKEFSILEDSLYIFYGYKNYDIANSKCPIIEKGFGTQKVIYTMLDRQTILAMGSGPT